MLDKSLGRGLVLSFRPWNVVAVKDIINLWHSSSGFSANATIPPGNHFIHNLFKFFLDFFSLFLDILISDLSLATLISENTLNICDRAPVRWIGSQSTKDCDTLSL